MAIPGETGDVRLADELQAATDTLKLAQHDARLFEVAAACMFGSL